MQVVQKIARHKTSDMTTDFFNATQLPVTGVTASINGFCGEGENCYNKNNLISKFYCKNNKTCEIKINKLFSLKISEKLIRNNIY